MKTRIRCWSLYGLVWLSLFACKAARSTSEKLTTENGKASYYANKFAGRKTASGERYRPSQLTAAHKKLPFGTMVKVTNVANGQSVVVRINDRGPFARGRLIDLSKAAAKKIGMIQAGVVPVRIEYQRVK